MLKPSARDREFKRAVGLLIIASALVLLFFLRVYQQAADPFKATVRLFTSADRADGMAVNAQVTMAGIKVGRVYAITLTDDNRVGLELEIDGHVATKLHADAQAIILRPLIGSTSVDIRQGSTGQALVKNGATIAGSTAPDINQIIATLPAKLEKVDATLGNLATVSNDLRHLSQAATTGDSSVERTLTHLQATSRKAEQAAGQLAGALDESRGVIRQAGLAAEQSRHILDDLRAGSVRVEALVDKVDRVVDDALILSRELRAMAPQVNPAVSSGRLVLDEADEVMQAAKNNFLLRASLPEPNQSPALPVPR